MTRSRNCLDAEELTARAVEQIGADDWGGDDFREGLDVLLHFCQEQAALSPFGRRKLTDFCLHHLANRLRVEDLVKRHPEILEEEVPGPIILATFPRSGSSLLHRLLCQVPGIRAPLYGEMFQPAPALGVEPSAAERNLRIHQAADLLLEPLETAFPEGAAARGTMPKADEAGECYVLFENSFTSFNYTFDYHIPGYLDWLCQLDFRPVYRYFKKQLQVLQWQAPGQPWCMKCADHLLGMDGLLDVFPDANIVLIHREPETMVPSLGNLQVCHMNLWREQRMDGDILGRYCLERYQRVVAQAAGLEERIAPEQVHALTYAQLTAGPIGEVQRLLEHFSIPVSPEAPGRLQAWLDSHPKPKNRYSLGAYGLDQGEVKESLAVYANHFEQREAKR